MNKEDMLIIESKEYKPCSICKTPTNYIEYLSEGRLCSKNCVDEFYKLVDKAEKLFWDTNAD